MRRTRRGLLATAGTVGAAALAGCTGILGGGDQTTPSGDALETAAATAPLPGDAADRTYAAMGTDGPTVTYFGNWKCPYCAEFAVGSENVLSLHDVVTDYIEPGRLKLEFRAVAYLPNGDTFLGPDAPRAARAGLAVWSLDPEAYWGYHETVMANQPPESEQWATTDRLVGFAEDAGVDGVGDLRSAIEAGRYADPVEANTQAFEEAGASGTPALVVGGDVHSPFEPEATREALDALAE